MQSDNSGLFLLLFGGIIPYLLFRSRPHGQLLCEQCGFVFRPVNRSAGRDFAVVVLLVAVLIAVVVFMLASVATHWPPVSPSNNALRRTPADSP